MKDCHVYKCDGKNPLQQRYLRNEKCYSSVMFLKLDQIKGEIRAQFSLFWFLPDFHEFEICLNTSMADAEEI